jgi:hypothetical protein
LIKEGNEFDEREFDRREKEFREGTGRLSMSPPPNKQDELRSRYEYYLSYCKEYFVQESDSLDNDPLQQRDVKRYLYYVRKSEKDRRWLLGDMHFRDPHKENDLEDLCTKFETMAGKYFGKNDVTEEGTSAPPPPPTSDGGGDGFVGVDDEEPEWFQKKFPHLR